MGMDEGMGVGRGIGEEPCQCTRMEKEVVRGITASV